MKTIIQLMLAILVVPICSSFTSVKNDGLDVTYGVHENDPSHIELTLNSDYTFTYQDFSISSEKLYIRGTYQIENRKVKLISDDEETEFHRNWRISKDSNSAKSRKGFTFYTLQKKINGLNYVSGQMISVAG